MKAIIHSNQYLLLKRNRNFSTVWFGTIFTVLADRIFLVVLPIWLYQISKSGQVVALGTTVQMVATLIFGFLGGVFIDRSKKKKLLIWLNFLASFVLLCLLATEMITLKWWIILIGVFSYTALTRLLATLRQVVVTSLVDNEDLIIANTMVGFIFSISLILGPLIASAGMALFGHDGTLVYCASSYFLYACLSMFIRMDEIQVENRSKRSLRKEMTQSFVVVKRNRFLWGNLVFMVFYMMGTGVFSSLTYVFIKTILEESVEIYSWNITLQGIGSIFGGIFVGMVSKHFRTHVAVGWIFLLISLLELSYLLTKSSMIMLLIGPIVGIMQQIAIVIANTTFQKHCPNEYLGRVVGLRQTVISIFTTVATGTGAFFLDYVTVDKILYCACGLLMICGVCGYLFIRDN
jgi:MFS transporter, DHA3 family, macrolide efflux protein